MPSTRLPRSRPSGRSHPYGTYLQQGQLSQAPSLLPLPGSSDAAQPASVSADEPDSSAAPVTHPHPILLSSSGPHVHNPLNVDISKKIPKPPNQYMIFRSEIVNKISSCVENQSQISRIASVVWGAMDDSQKEPYRVKAQILKDEHANKYPNYTYHKTTNKKANRGEVDDNKNRKIAELLLDGIHGKELETKVRDLGSVQLTARTESMIKKRRSKISPSPISDDLVSQPVPSSRATSSNPAPNVSNAVSNTQLIIPVQKPLSPSTSLHLSTPLPSPLINTPSLTPSRSSSRVSWQAPTLSTPPSSIYAPSPHSFDTTSPDSHSKFVTSNNPLDYDLPFSNPGISPFPNIDHIHTSHASSSTSYSGQSGSMGVPDAPLLKPVSLPPVLESSIPTLFSAGDSNVMAADCPLGLFGTMSSEVQSGAVGAQITTLSTMPPLNSEESLDWYEGLLNSFAAA